MGLFKARRVYEDHVRAERLPDAPRPHYYRRDAHAPLAAVTFVSTDQVSCAIQPTRML